MDVAPRVEPLDVFQWLQNEDGKHRIRRAKMNEEIKRERERERERERR